MKQMLTHQTADMLGRLNLALTASAVVLAGYLVVRISTPFVITPSLESGERLNRAGSMRSESRAFPQFSADLFKQRSLFPSKTARQTTQPGHNFVFLGVSTGDKVLASVRDTVTQKVYYFAPGDEFEGLRVIDITSTKVTLEVDGKTVEIPR